MDPNSIVGAPKDRWVWLAPDWSDHKPETAKQPSGYTRVRVRDIPFADGRIVTVVLDEAGRPVAADGTPTAPAQARVLDQITDPDQERRFKDQQTAASREQAQAERKVVRTYTGTDPQTGRPAAVTEYESGPPKYEEIGAEASSPTAQRTAREEAEIAANAALPPDQDPRSETNAERAARADARIKEQGEQARREQGTARAPSVQTVQGGDGQTYTRVVTIGENGAPTIKQYGPNGQEVAQIPGEKEKPSVRQVQGSDGQTYTIVTTMNASGTPTVTTYDPGGKVVSAVPTKADDPKPTQIIEENGEKKEVIRNPDGTIKDVRPLPGASSGGAGPRMPSILADQSSETLTNYYNQLRDDPSLTPAQRERRLQEAIQIATFAQTEANRAQQEIQSNRGAHVNVATARLSYMQAGMGQALDFVSKFNDKLPPGSNLGGKAFAALLNLQMIRAKDSGIYDLYPPGTTGPWTGRPQAPKTDPGPPKLTNPNDPAAVDADLQASAERIRGITNTTDAGGVPRERTPSAPATTGPLGPPSEADRQRILADRQPASPPAAVAPTAPTTTPAGAGTPTAPATVPPSVSTALPPQPSEVAGGVWVRDTQSQNRQFVPRSKLPAWLGPGSPWVVEDGGAPQAQAQPPQFAALAPYLAPTPQPTAGGASMPPPMPTPEPAPDFAALAPYQPPSMPAPEQQPTMQQTPLALLQAQAAAAVPWNLSDDQIQQYLAAGVPEETIFAVPGRNY
jgi:hypothetical protein